MKSNIQSWLDDELIFVEEKACKNYGNRQQVCQSCVDICPTDAIQFKAQIPTVDSKKCMNCGACIGECSVLAIQHKSKPYHEIVEQIQAFPSVNITCEQLDSYQNGIKIPCYLYLDPALLLEYKKGKEEVTFYIGNCQSCERAGIKQVESHFEKLEEQLLQLGSNINFIFTTEPFNSEVDQVVSGMTRRDLLKQISIKNIRELLLPTKKEGIEEQIKKTDLSWKEKVSFKKDLINVFINTNEVNTSIENNTLSKDLFLDIAEIKSCRGCNICEQICPTKAIKWQNIDNKSTLIFNQQQCIACKKCLACPEKAIEFLSVDRESYVKSSIKELITLKLNTCNECGDSFKTLEQEEVCEFCKAKANKDPARFFI